MNVFAYTSLRGQFDLDDTNIPTPNIFLRQQGSLGHIVIAENEVEDILKMLYI
jgi:hypothetical protein